MGKYIGQELSYGTLEKEAINTSSIGPYTLRYRVPEASNILVVCDRILLEPEVDYEVDQSGVTTQLKLNVDLTMLDGDATNDMSLYVIYLGKSLSVPVPFHVQERLKTAEDKIKALEDALANLTGS